VQVLIQGNTLLNRDLNPQQREAIAGKDLLPKGMTLCDQQLLILASLGYLPPAYISYSQLTMLTIVQLEILNGGQYVLVIDDLSKVPPVRDIDDSTVPADSPGSPAVPGVPGQNPIGFVGPDGRHPVTDIIINLIKTELQITIEQVTIIIANKFLTWELLTPE